MRDQKLTYLKAGHPDTALAELLENGWRIASITPDAAGGGWLILLEKEPQYESSYIV